jgi:hypothetical protein
MEELVRARPVKNPVGLAGSSVHLVIYGSILDASPAAFHHHHVQYYKVVVAA